MLHGLETMLNFKTFQRNRGNSCEKTQLSKQFE